MATHSQNTGSTTIIKDSTVAIESVKDSTLAIDLVNIKTNSAEDDLIANLPKYHDGYTPVVDNVIIINPVIKSGTFESVSVYFDGVLVPQQAALSGHGYYIYPTGNQITLLGSYMDTAPTYIQIVYSEGP